MLKKTGILLLLFSRIIICNGQCSYNDLLPKINMVINGNFSAGNTGFTCDYTYSTINPLSEAKYIITTDASLVHFAFKGNDHTTGTGNFMVLNGWSAPSNVWKQTVTVKPNTYYRYSAWLKNIVEKTMYSGAPIATCQLWINGQAVTDPLALPDFPDVWKKLDTLWYSGINTTANLVIKNWGTSLNGNDFAIDDISFKECCTQLQGKPLGNYILCNGDSVQLVASSGSSFIWTPSLGLSNTTINNPYAKPTSFTRYIVTSQYAICTHIDTFDVDVKNLNANAGLDTAVCKGQSIQLNATGGIIYQWLNPYKLDSPFISNPVVSPLTDTAYIVRVAVGAACYGFDTVNVKAIALPEVFAGSDLWHCYNGMVQLNGFVKNASNFIWTPLSGLSADTILNPYAAVQTKAEYILTAQNGKCKNSDTIIVNPMPKIIVDFDMNPEIGFIQATIEFYNKSKNAVLYEWKFGIPGSGSTIENPKYIYNEIGEYTIWLIAKDSLGCTDSTFKTLKILDKPELVIPNVFSPNGDGSNDYFKINYTETGFEYLAYTIYNRWGDLLYETRFPGGKWWDGFYKSKPSPEGVYFYIIEARDITNKKYNLHGTLTLIR